MLFSITSPSVLPLVLSNVAPSHITLQQYTVGLATEVRHTEGCNNKGSTDKTRLSDVGIVYEVSQCGWEIYSKEIKQRDIKHKIWRAEVLRMISGQAQDIC